MLPEVCVPILHLKTLSPLQVFTDWLQRERPLQFTLRGILRVAQSFAMDTTPPTPTCSLLDCLQIVCLFSLPPSQARCWEHPATHTPFILLRAVPGRVQGYALSPSPAKSGWLCVRLRLYTLFRDSCALSVGTRMRHQIGREMGVQSTDGAHGLAGGHRVMCPTRLMGGPLVGVCKVVSRIRGSVLSDKPCLCVPRSFSLFLFASRLFSRAVFWVGPERNGFQVAPCTAGRPGGLYAVTVPWPRGSLLAWRAEQLWGMGDTGKMKLCFLPSSTCLFSDDFSLQQGSGTSLVDSQTLQMDSPLWVVVKISVSTGRQGCKLLPYHLADITPSHTT